MKQRTSILIIGAGIIGASIAYHLSRKGVKDVLIVDKSKAGSGSTSAALGGFRSQFSSELSVKLSQKSISFLEQFKELTGYDPLLKRDGYIFIASEKKSYDLLKKNVELQRKLGVNVSLLTIGELKQKFPFYNFDSFLGGTFCQEDGHASTLSVHQGFLSKAKESGVELEENAEVVSIKQIKDREFDVQTTRGRVYAESVIIAAGAYSGLVGRMASIDIPVQPFPRKILVTKSFTDGIPIDIPAIIDVDSTFAFGRDGTGLIFADNRPMPPGFDLIFPEDYDETILRIAVERVPLSAKSSISFADVGLYEVTPDSNPIVCEIPEKKGLYVCAGFAGHGFMHSPAIGEIMSELLTTGKTSLDISSYHIGRFSKSGLEREQLII